MTASPKPVSARPVAADPVDSISAVDAVWGSDDAPLVVVARNVTTRYLAIGNDALIVVSLLTFNIRHLGQSAYGLWMLTTSMMTYFSEQPIWSWTGRAAMAGRPARCKSRWLTGS